MPMHTRLSPLLIVRTAAAATGPLGTLYFAMGGLALLVRQLPIALKNRCHDHLGEAGDEMLLLLLCAYVCVLSARKMR